mmetsp:Transcript_6833/g.9847  ORF Transcript_6833/g.9847 Transcript_6833/m.9847 type:complete len:112 (-) Transcript_6833:42-377(-)
MVNGDLGESWPAIERFGVDAIPHLALITADGNVETALIGPIPRTVLRADLDALIEASKMDNAIVCESVNPGVEDVTVAATSCSQTKWMSVNLPYKMYDAFRNRPDMRHVQF